MVVNISAESLGGEVDVLAWTTADASQIEEDAEVQLAAQGCSFIGEIVSGPFVILSGLFTGGVPVRIVL